MDENRVFRQVIVTYWDFIRLKMFVLAFTPLNLPFFPFRDVNFTTAMNQLQDASTSDELGKKAQVHRNKSGISP